MKVSGIKVDLVILAYALFSRCKKKGNCAVSTPERVFEKVRAEGLSSKGINRRNVLLDPFIYEGG